jgi:hypothetical protein
LAEEKSEAKTSGKKRDYTLPIIFIVIVLAFAGAFLAFKTLRTNEYEIGGLRVLAKQDPVGEAKRILSPQKILVQENLYSGNSSKNSAVAIQAAEIVRVLRTLGKNVSVYGVVEGIPLNETCKAENNYCNGAQVIVTIKDVAQGACNCLKIGLNGDAIETEGNEAFYIKDNYAIITRVAGFIGGVVNG